MPGVLGSANGRTATAVVLLAAIAIGALSAGQVAQRRAVLTAAARAALQLALVGLLLAGVLRAPLGTAAFLLVMLTVACATTTRRLAAFGRPWRQVLLASLVGAAPPVVAVLAVGALPFTSRYVLALTGIVLGGTMTVSTLAGRRLHDAMVRRRDEVEAWLSLGASSRQAVAGLTRVAVTEALLPSLDQTRTVGLVTLPGAFVGALAGGASPAAAARFQLLVLVSLLAAGSLAGCTLVYLLGAPATLPEADSEQVARDGPRAAKHGPGKQVGLGK